MPRAIHITRKDEPKIATTKSLRQSALEIAQDGIQSMSVGNRSWNHLDPEKILRTARMENEDAAAGDPAAALRFVSMRGGSPRE
jgi:hypothetical protein